MAWGPATARGPERSARPRLARWSCEFLPGLRGDRAGCRRHPRRHRPGAAGLPAPGRRATLRGWLRRTGGLAAGRAAARGRGTRRHRPDPFRRRRARLPDGPGGPGPRRAAGPNRPEGPRNRQPPHGTRTSGARTSGTGTPGTRTSAAGESAAGSGPVNETAQDGLNVAVWHRIAAAGARSARWPWWLQVGGLYLAARLVSACIFMAAALQQGVNPWFPPKPDYWNFINIWDARWYAQVIANGYPSVLPTDAAGNVQENTWAFYPLFPALAGGLSRLTGMNSAASLTLIAMLAGWGAALLAYLLFRQKADHGQAMWGVAFFSTFPVSAV